MKRNFVSHFVTILAATVLWISCDTAGNIEDPNKNYFIKFIGSDGDQEGVDMVVNNDGTMYLLGNTMSSDPNAKQRIFLVLVDEFGKVLWERKYGDPAFNYEARDLEMTNDSRLVFVGNKEKAINDTDVYIKIIGLDGVELDSTEYSAPGTTNEIANSVTQTSDGFIVAGSTTDLSIKPAGTPLPPNQIDVLDALSLRFFDDLTIYPTSWFRAYGPGTYDEATKIIQTGSNPDRFYLFGTSNDPALADLNYWIIQLGSNGDGINILPPSAIGNSTNDEQMINARVDSVGQNFILLGKSDSGGISGLFVVKLRSPLGFTSADVEAQPTISGNNLEGIQSSRSLSSGFIIIGNEGVSPTRKILLHRLGNNLNPVWTTRLLFGGGGDDFAGSVEELPNGKIVILGTMSLGKDGQKKMALIKLNSDGKFLN